jgi:hypothetical protein
VIYLDVDTDDPQNAAKLAHDVLTNAGDPDQRPQWRIDRMEVWGPNRSDPEDSEMELEFDWADVITDPTSKEQVP